MPSYLLGVDGGTTKTIALVADARGRIVGAGRRGGSNWTGANVEAPMSVVIEACRQALARADLMGRDVTHGVFALAGADWPEDYERRRAVLERAGIARRVIVKNDAFAGMRAGSGQPYGVVIAAGTGINAAASAPDGREWAFGYYATAGGGGNLAGEAIEAVLRDEDGRGPRTMLTPLVLERLAYPSVEAMLRGITAGEVSAPAHLSIVPLIFDASCRGDAVASDIIVRQGLVLAEYATALIRRFDMARMEFDVVLAGSIFKGRGPLLVDTVTQAVHRVAPAARVVTPRLEPAAGAVLLAFDAAGLAPHLEIHRNLETTSPPAAFFSTADGEGYKNPRETASP